MAPDGTQSPAPRCSVVSSNRIKAWNLPSPSRTNDKSRLSDQTATVNFMTIRWKVWIMQLHACSQSVNAYEYVNDTFCWLWSVMSLYCAFFWNTLLVIPIYQCLYNLNNLCNEPWIMWIIWRFCIFTYSPLYSHHEGMLYTGNVCLSSIARRIAN